MHDFDYVSAGSTGELVDLLKQHKGKARLLAGGTDLIVGMRTGRRQPEMVIDIKRIPQMRALQMDGDGLRIGAAVSCREIWEHPGIREAYPALIESTELVGGIQIQGRASVGGNLCNAAPSADTVPSLIAHAAQAHVLGSAGERQVAVEDFCTGPGTNALAEDECLVAISLRPPAPHSGAAFLRFIPRNEMDIAVANVASFVELDKDGKQFKAARIAIGAVAPTPLFVEQAGDALRGQEVSQDNINAAAVLARNAASPINDMRGTVAHRKQLVEVLTRRTLTTAIARARGESS